MNCSAWRDETFKSDCLMMRGGNAEGTVYDMQGVKLATINRTIDVKDF